MKRSVVSKPTVDKLIYTCASCAVPPRQPEFPYVLKKSTCEDVELAWRLRLGGHGTGVETPDASVTT